MFGFLGRLFSKDIGIDLGTANTVVYVRGEGVVYTEPSVVAIRSSTKEIIAVGLEAKKMVGKTPDNIKTVRPLKDGVIADFDMTCSMINFFMSKVHNNRKFLVHPRVIICIPSGVTDVERRAVVDATLNAGAREAYLIEEPVAAAIGAGLMIHEPRGNMIVDIGGGTTEVAVLSLGGIVVNDSIRIAGDEIDAAIMDLMRQEYNILIGEQTAEEIKMTLGSVLPLDEELEAEVKGRDVLTGLPKVIKITSAHVREAIVPVVERMVDMVRATLERTPPELVRDIVDQGIVLTGGGSLLKGLDAKFSSALGVPVFVSESPLLSVALGIGKVLEELDALKKILVSVDRGV